LGALALVSSFVVSGCLNTGAVTCGDQGYCPPDTVCTTNQKHPVCVPARGCGNGEIDEAGEEVCDDGNIKGGDGCDATCSSNETCGNLFTDDHLEEPEQCDDGEETSICDADCTEPECGDGMLNRKAGEVCDDGNTDAGDGCDGSCKSEECGNGVTEDAFDEECDDGTQCDDGTECTNDDDCPDGDMQCKTRGDDGCSSDCQLELCGNGIRNSGEACDDGNKNNSDDCVVKSKTECFIASCGDGFLHDEEHGTEECDTLGDSEECNSDCTLSVCGDGKVNRVDGEKCDDEFESADCNADCTLARCGDGKTNAEAGEECDTSGDSATCDKDCTFAECEDGYRNSEAGEECDTGGPSSFCNGSCQLSSCGDGETDAASGEDCDDGQQSPTCNLNCSTAMCGDGIVNSEFIVDPLDSADTTSTEQCDPNTGTDDANDQRALANAPACDRDCTFARCGDSYENGQAGEECDDAYVANGLKTPTNACNSDCTDAACGDGKLNSAFVVDLYATPTELTGKECDPNTGTASAKRASADGPGCDSDCSAVRCGDGHRNQPAGEDCDDTYLESGTPTETASCDDDCTFPACGDGNANAAFSIRLLYNNTATAPSEQCDPDTGTTSDNKRAAADNDVCDKDCSSARCGDEYINAARGETCEFAYVQSQSYVPQPRFDCDSDCTAPECGDGLLNGPAGEDCDPGELDDQVVTPGDPNLATDDSPSCNRDCTDADCGDGYTNDEAGEECDDDNNDNNDDCLNNCQDAACGDGVKHATDEQCDDGNGSNTDNCVAGCKNAKCGDGFIHAGPEDCDDGNGVDNDACPNDCTLP